MGTARDRGTRGAPFGKTHPGGGAAAWGDRGTDGCGSLGGFMGPNHAGDRSSFPRYVATPLAGLLNVKEKVRLKATPNAVLERFYAATSKHPKQVRAQGVPRGVLGDEGG